MKKTLAVLLTLALVCSASAAFAASIVPEQASENTDFQAIAEQMGFAELHASVPDQYDRVTVTLSKPVDRLWANWMGEGETPEELFPGENNSVTFSTKGHKYQVGAQAPAKQTLFKEESGPRHIISFGALESQINWRTIQAQEDRLHGDCVEVVEPKWIVYRVVDGVVMDEYDDKLVSGDIKVPDGCKLTKVLGYTVAWHYSSYGSDGSPNLAYITLQGDYVVVYARNGKIQYVGKYEHGSTIFGVYPDAPTEEPETVEPPAEVLSAVYVPQSVKDYVDLPEMPPVYTFAGLTAITSPDGKTVTVHLDKPVDRIWANWMGKEEGPEELFPDENLTCTYSTVGHKYQVGSAWVNDYIEMERGPRHEIVWQAYPSRVNWATAKAMEDRHEGDCVKVVLPHWELIKISNNTKCFEIDDDVNCTDIEVPDGYKLVKKVGYAVAWYPVGLSSDGSPNLAYITEQNGYTVIYARSGKIVSVTKTVADSNFFGNGVGVGTVRYERSVFDRWYTSEVTEVYEDNSFVTATYSKYGNGKLTDCQVSDF